MDSNTAVLARRFGLATAVFLVVANMIGSGVLTSTGFMLRNTGSIHTVLLIWVVGGILSLCGAICMAEMATAFPKVGGDYVYVREAFGRRIAFSYGVSMVVLGFAAPAALSSYTIASYFWPHWQTLLGSAGAFGLLNTETAFCKVCASLLVVFFTLAHSRGHNESALTQGVTTLFKIVILIIFIALGLSSPNVNWNYYNSQAYPVEFKGIGSSFILVMYCYTGWNAAVYIAGEIRDPVKNLWRSLVFGTLFVVILYLLLNVIFGLAFSPEETSRLTEGELAFFADAVTRKLFSPGTGELISFLISLGVLASISSFVMTGPRIVFAMAHDGLIPARFGKVDEKRAMPRAALFLQCLISLLMLATGSFELILQISGFGLGLLSLGVVLPIFWLRNKASYKPAFKVKLYPFLPTVFVVVSVAVLLTAAFEDLQPAVVSSLVVSIPYFIFSFIQYARKKR